jgi:hypothetical protein
VDDQHAGQPGGDQRGCEHRGGRRDAGRR